MPTKTKGVRPDLTNDRPRCWDCGRYAQQLADGTWVHWGTGRAECGSEI